jgi:uncharacterized protein (TIRG00374 family)
MRSRRGHVLRLLRWGIALAAFWYVARGVDWSATLSNLATVPPTVTASILAITALEFGSRFAMWHTLLNALGGVSLPTTARIDLTIKFVNHVLPSKASGHSVAPLVLRHYGGVGWTEAVSLAGVNTGLYAGLYGVTALAGVAILAGRLSAGWLFVFALSTGLYLAAGALVLLAGRRLDVAGRLVGRLESLFARIPRIGSGVAGVAGRLPSFTADSAAVFRDLSSRPSVVIPYALGWAGTLLVFPALRVWLLLAALDGSFAPVVLLPLVLVVAYSVTILPLTPGGIGVAEASATAAFVSLGVRPELAAVVVLVDRSLGVYLPAVLGWIPVARLDLSELLAGDA